ncbi:MAG: hypothetical protein RLP44_03425 [Aggregatilineales bacterium]
MPDIINELYRCGLIQFGLFDDAPIRLSFKLLPSYPRLLKKVAENFVFLINETNTESPYEKLLCDINSLSLTTLVSQSTGIPVIYAQDRHSSAAHDFVGAYDVGHKTALICNVWRGEADRHELIEKAERGGLIITDVLTILDLRSTPSEPAVRVASLWTIEQLLEDLLDEHLINTRQVQLVTEWKPTTPE